MTVSEFEQLVEDARAVHSRMTPAQLAHEHHAQRVDWVTGELRLLHPDFSAEDAAKHARAAAGSCPCDDCLVARASGSRSTREVSKETLAALAEACKEQEP